MVQYALVPVKTPELPVLEPVLHLAWVHEELQIPLLKLTLAKQKVSRCDLVSERLPNLADAKGNLHTRRVEHIVVVQIDVLAGLSAEIGFSFVTFNHPD